MLDAKILFVDKDPAMRRVMERILCAEGAQVVAAEGCQEALALFERERPDLVILDAGVVGDEAFGVCRRLRQRSQVPIILLSAVDETEQVIKGLACGADDYIAKPFDLVVLCARIRAVLRRCGYPLARLQPAGSQPAAPGIFRKY
jgi:DNA-binding response OmpR family regulator